MLLPGRNKVPGQIKQGGGPDSALGPCVCHLVDYSNQDSCPPEPLTKVDKSENLGKFQKLSTCGCRGCIMKDLVQSSVETAISAKAVPLVETATL